MCHPSRPVAGMGGILRLDPVKVVKICEAYEGHGATFKDFEKVMSYEDVVYPLLLEAAKIERDKNKKQ